MGTLTLSSIDWKTLTNKDVLTIQKEINEDLLATVSDLYLTRVVEEPACGRNILYLVVTSSPDLIEEVQTVAGISAHHVVKAKYKHRVKPN